MRTPERILIVDDEPDLRDCLRELLECEGYEVLTAGNGREALGHLESRPGFGLILLDFMMPVMDARAFREKQLASSRLKHIPTVLLSAANLTPDVVAQVAPDAMLRKPIDVEVLLSEIKSRVLRVEAATREACESAKTSLF